MAALLSAEAIFLSNLSRIQGSKKILHIICSLKIASTSNAICWLGTLAPQNPVGKGGKGSFGHYYPSSSERAHKTLTTAKSICLKIKDMFVPSSHFEESHLFYNSVLMSSPAYLEVSCVVWTVEVTKSLKE